MLLATAAAPPAATTRSRLEQLVRHVGAFHAIAKEEVRRVRCAAGQDARPELAQSRFRSGSRSEATERSVRSVHEARHAHRKGTKECRGIATLEAFVATTTKVASAPIAGSAMCVQGDRTHFSCATTDIA